jgi:putative ABC transport system substrate-binding protein
MTASLNRQRILEFAARERLPVISGWGPWVEAGALLSYGPDLDATVHRAATYVDQILNGADPANLPVEQPTKFELMINLKTARIIGIVIPQTVLLRADKVIR